MTDYSYLYESLGAREEVGGFVTRLLNVSSFIAVNVCTIITYPLVTGGEVGEREGQARLGGGSSSLSSSEELSSVRSITSTFLLLLLLVWDELFLCSESTGRHEPVQKVDQKQQQKKDDLHLGNKTMFHL